MDSARTRYRDGNTPDRWQTIRENYVRIFGQLQRRGHFHVHNNNVHESDTSEESETD